MSQELEDRIKLLAQGIATDIKDLTSNIGALQSLPTSNKNSVVESLAELFNLLPSTGVGDMLKSANLAGLTDVVAARSNLDVMSTTQVTFAISAITLAGLGGVDQTTVDTTVNAAIQQVLGMPPETFNTLAEIATELEADNTAFATLTNTVSTKVSFSAAQTLTAAQKAQACANIGVGNPDRNFLADYIAVRDA